MRCLRAAVHLSRSSSHKLLTHLTRAGLVKKDKFEVYKENRGLGNTPFSPRFFAVRHFWATLTHVDNSLGLSLCQWQPYIWPHSLGWVISPSCHIILSGENKSKDVLFSLGRCVVIIHTLIVAITRLQFNLWRWFSILPPTHFLIPKFEEKVVKREECPSEFIVLLSTNECGA